MKRLFLVAVLLAGCGGPEAATAGKGAAYEVKGVRLGMTVEEVKAVYPQIQVEVDAHPNGHKRTTFMPIEFDHPRHTLSIRLTTTYFGDQPERVSSINYYNDFVSPEQRITPDTMRKMLVEKYGKPTDEVVYESGYYDKNKADFCYGDTCQKLISGKADESRNTLYAKVRDGGIYITATDGPAGARGAAAWKASEAARIEAEQKRRAADVKF